jgi:hypothetical protein
VIPRELSPERPAGELPAGIPIEGGSTTMPDGTFRCECGAVGWMRGACVLDPRAPERPPSATQRRFLEALAEGPRTNLDLSEKFLQSDLSTYGEVSLALAAGWATAQIGGIGGLVARPPLIYELTDRGREALGLDPE